MCLRSLDRLDILDHIVRHNRAELLQTPIVEKVIEVFWTEFGRTAYNIQVLFSAVFLLSLACVGLSGSPGVVIAAAAILFICNGYYVYRLRLEFAQRSDATESLVLNLGSIVNALKSTVTLVCLVWRLAAISNDPDDLHVVLRILEASAVVLHAIELIELAKVPRMLGPLVVMVNRMIQDFVQVATFFLLVCATFAVAISMVASPSSFSTFDTFLELALIILGDSSSLRYSAYNDLGLPQKIVSRVLFLSCKFICTTA